MIHVTSLTVRSFELDHLDIFWEIPATQEIVEEHDFYILKSVDGAGGPYRQIAGPFYNTFLFRDPDVHQLHKWRQYFYRVKVVHRPSGDTWESQPAYHEAQPDLITMELRRRENLLFQEFAGRKVLLYPQLTFGQRCRHCWDVGTRGNTIGRATQQNCISCFDTTFVGGYASPILIFLQIDPTTKQPQQTNTEEHAFIESSARTTAFPPIKPKDMIVEGENIRWRVEQVTPTQKLRATVRQELRIRQYPRDDIKYKVPIQLDLQTAFSPEREFTRPMDLQPKTTDEKREHWLKEGP
jgi:hypothetical protein